MNSFRVFSSEQKKRYMNSFNNSAVNKNSLRSKIRRDSYKVRIRSMAGLNNRQKANYNQGINAATTINKLNQIITRASSSSKRALRVANRANIQPNNQRNPKQRKITA